MTPRLEIKFVLLILSVAALVYANSVPNDFIWDDVSIIRENPFIRELSNIPKAFTTSYWDNLDNIPKTGNYRPLTTISYILNHALAGPGPEGFRAVNIALHSVNSVLVYLLATLLGLGGWFALFGGLLFAVHPVHTEAVVWIVGRAEIMACAFLLGSLALYLHNRAKGRPVLLLASAILYGAALFSKESAASLPLLIFAYSFMVNENGPGKRVAGAFFGALPYLIMTAAYLALRASVLGSVGDKDLTFFAGVAPFDVFLTMVKVMASYWRLLFYPAGLRAHYDLVDFPVPSSVAEPEVLWAVFANLFFVTAAVFLFFRKRPAIAFSLAWVFLAITPYSHLLPFKWLMAERFLYIPSAGFSILIAFLAKEALSLKLPSFKNIVAPVLGIAVLASFSSVTVSRNRDWKDEIAFFEKMISQEPDLAPAYANYGNALYLRGRIDDAIAAYKKAVELYPGYAEARQSLDFLELKKSAIEIEKGGR